MSSTILPPASIPPSSLHTPTDLHTACQEFESLFLALLLRQMQATVPRAGILPSSAGRRLFDSLWLQEISRTAAPEIEDPRLDALSQEVRAGRYRVPAELVADAMLRDLGR